jgi:hypothetical protein
MAMFKYNSSTVVGRDGPQEPFSLAPQRIWLDTSFSLAARAFCAWCFGKPVGWVYKIEVLRSELGLTKQNWRTIASELKSRGVIKQDKKEMGDVWFWEISLNFTIFELPTKIENQPLTRAAREGLKSTPHASGGNQHIAAGVEINKLPKPSSDEEEPQRGSGGDSVNKEEDGEMSAIAGLTKSNMRGVGKILDGAAAEQRAAALAVLEGRASVGWAGVKDPAAFAIAIARRAEKGEVTVKKSTELAELPPAQRASARLDRLGWRGDHPIYGMVEVIQYGEFSFQSKGAQLDLRGDDAQRCWQLHLDGGLDLKPPN